MDEAKRLYYQEYIKAHVAVDPDTDCWNWTGGISPTGYGVFHGGRAHRLSYMLFKGPIPFDLVVRHQCHNRCCCNPAHLLLGTDQDNTNDTLASGRLYGRSKLTEQKVRDIRSLYKQGISMRKIASTYNVGHTAIFRIVNGIAWAHVKDDPREL